MKPNDYVIARSYKKQLSPTSPEKWAVLYKDRILGYFSSMSEAQEFVNQHKEIK